VSGVVFDYTCECNDLNCRRRVRLSEAQYRRLSVLGNVVHSDHVESGGLARGVAVVNGSEELMGREGPIGIAYAVTLQVGDGSLNGNGHRRGACGVRAW
jgi:hypothetical protein